MRRVTILLAISALALGLLAGCGGGGGGSTVEYSGETMPAVIDSTNAAGLGKDSFAYVGPVVAIGQLFASDAVQSVSLAAAEPLAETAGAQVPYSFEYTDPEEGGTVAVDGTMHVTYNIATMEPVVPMIFQGEVTLTNFLENDAFIFNGSVTVDDSSVISEGYVLNDAATAFSTEGEFDFFWADISFDDLKVSYGDLWSEALALTEPTPSITAQCGEGDMYIESGESVLVQVYGLSVDGGAGTYRIEDANVEMAEGLVSSIVPMYEPMPMSVEVSGSLADTGARLYHPEEGLVYISTGGIDGITVDMYTGAPYNGYFYFLQQDYMEVVPVSAEAAPLRPAQGGYVDFDLAAAANPFRYYIYLESNDGPTLEIEAGYIDFDLTFVEDGLWPDI
jgi:hypothetical protein